MLNVGMVGVGNISGIYLENFTNVFRDVKLVAVCDLIRERAEKAQAEYNVPKLYDTMDQLFADPEIDIVLNLTRPYQHYGVSKAALLAGKHVYCEKPLAADLEEGKELVALAQEKGLFLGGAPDTFMGAGVQTARKVIDEGLIGDVIGGHCAMCCHGMESWHTDPDFYYQRAGGPMFDMGPYYLTALVNMLGGIKEIYSKCTAGYKTRLITAEPHVGEIIQVNTPTHIDSLLTFESGAVVSLMTSFDIYSSKQTNIEIYGTKGTLTVPDPNGFWDDLIFHDGEKDEDIYIPKAFDYCENSRCLGLDDAAAAIESGRRPRASYLQTYHVLEVMCGALESGKTGMPVKIASSFTREAPMDPTLPHGHL